MTYAAMGLGAVALAMVIFYYFQDRTRKPEGYEEVGEQVEGTVQETRSEFAGLYAATDGSMEAAGKRITSFQVINSDGGGLSGSARLDTIGSDEQATLNCYDVRIDAKEFFLKCQDANLGMISLNGAWAKDDAGQISVAGKVLWTQNGNLLLDVSRNFQLITN